jgi:hypothetical protein
MRRVTRALFIAVAGLLLAACGTNVGPPPGPASSSSPVVPDADGRPPSQALGLVGLWRVTASGEEADTWLRLDAGEFHLWRPCGFVMGSWVASESGFLAAGYGWHPDCESATIPWLDSTVAYRGSATGWELLDEEREITAVLRDDGAPPPHPDILDLYRESPTITGEVRDAFRQPAALPPGLAAATARDLTGAWAPVGLEVTTQPGATFLAAGSYSASDGCNGSAGRWAIEQNGLLLTTSGPSTQIGCDGAAVPGWVALARRAAMDGDVLVLLDAGGAELGRLRSY